LILMSRSRPIRWEVWMVAFLLLLPGCVAGPRGFPPSEGIANFDQVNPRLYRGAQPNRVGLQHLHRLGVRTIVNLRGATDAWMAEGDEARALGMEYHHIPLSSFRRPDGEAVARVLSIIEKSDSPVFVHCQYGCERTGTIIACHRIQRDGWTSHKALNEATTYGMFWWQFRMRGFVRDFEPISGVPVDGSDPGCILSPLSRM